MSSAGQGEAPPEARISRKVRLAVVFVASLAVAVGFVMPTVFPSKCGRDRTHVRCASNLRTIQKLGQVYAETVGGGSCPYSHEGGLTGLQVLLASQPGLSPDLFICPGSRLEPAEAGPDGRFTLGEDHCSFEMVPWRLSLRDPGEAIVAFDRNPDQHAGGRNVVHLDGSLEYLEEAKFQEKLSADRARFAGRPGPAEGK
jgi:hypothetical protein